MIKRIIASIMSFFVKLYFKLDSECYCYCIGTNGDDDDFDIHRREYKNDKKNLELTTFEKESKIISETYHVPSYHSDCFVANHGDTDFICDACLYKAKCLLIKEKENKK